MESFQKNLLNLIEKGSLAGVLEKLTLFVNSNVQDHEILKNDLIHIKFRYSRIQEKIYKGLISADEENRYFNELAAVLIDFIRRMQSTNFESDNENLKRTSQPSPSFATKSSVVKVSEEGLVLRAFNELNQRLEMLLERLGNIDGITILQEKINNWTIRLKNFKSYVSIIGESDSAKFSFINSLFSKNLLPIQNTNMGQVPSVRFEYGEKEELIVTHYNGDRSFFSDFEDFFYFNKPGEHGFDSIFEYRLPDELLINSEYVLVPNELSPYSRAVFDESARKSNCILFVIDLSWSPNRSFLDCIKYYADLNFNIILVFIDVDLHNYGRISAKFDQIEKFAPEVNKNIFLTSSTQQLDTEKNEISSLGIDKVMLKINRIRQESKDLNSLSVAKHFIYDILQMKEENSMRMKSAFMTRDINLERILKIENLKSSDHDLQKILAQAKEGEKEITAIINKLELIDSEIQHAYNSVKSIIDRFS